MPENATIVAGSFETFSQIRASIRRMADESAVMTLAVEDCIFPFSLSLVSSLLSVSFPFAFALDSLVPPTLSLPVAFPYS